MTVATGRGMPEVPLLFVDLDGTIRKGYDDLGRWVNGPDDVEVFPEAVDRLRAWRAGGGRVLGVTNQGGIALGHVTVDAVHAAIRRTVELTGGLIDEVAVCDHHPAAAHPARARCWCRKPYPGLLIGAAELLSRALGERYPTHMALMVGDRDEDRAAAEAAGVDFAWAADWRAGRA